MAHLNDAPEPFTAGYRFEVTGGNENLRDPHNWNIEGQISVSQTYTVLEPLSDRGRWQYVLVQSDTGETYALCINDKLEQTPIQIQAEPAEIEPVVVAALDPTIDLSLEPESLPELQLETALDQAEVSGVPRHNFNPEMMDENGVLSEAVGPLRIESVIPWGVDEGFITLSSGNRSNGNVPHGEVVRIVRENGTFVFADSDIRDLARSDGGVRVAAGDQISFGEVETPAITDDEIETYDSLIAGVMNEKASWTPRRFSTTEPAK